MTININSSQLFKIVQTTLLVAILGLLLWSTPWSEGTQKLTRKVTVSGQATIEAEPDEYVFYPNFQKSGTDQEAIKEELTSTSNTAVEKLKSLGVEEKNIKLDASSYDYWFLSEDNEGTLNVSLTIKVQDKELAQDIQDYLQTLDVKGQLTPSANFSEDKKKELDKQAVDEAVEDARAKAEQQAKLLGLKVGDVIEISTAQDSIFPVAYDSARSVGLSLEAEAESLPILPGENKYTQSISVVYELQ